MTGPVDPAQRAPGAATRWWNAAAPVYDAILAHPFLQGLTDGTLPPATFEYYLVQDAHYLRGYARALALVGAHAHDAADVALFTQHAADAITVERELHASLLSELAVAAHADAVLNIEAGPATTAYIDHLLATCATGSFSDGLATVLPCYWIYAQVGQRLLARSSPDPLYARWISTHAGPAFADTVGAVLDVLAHEVGDAGSES